jgi:hypothetical protein
MESSQVQTFIQKYRPIHIKYLQEHNLPSPPTGKQRRFIKAIEKYLGKKFEGETFHDARCFLEEWAPRFYEYRRDMIEQGIWTKNGQFK